MGRPGLSGGPRTDVYTYNTLVLAAAATPPLEIGCIVLITTAADAGRRYRRTALSTPGIAGDFELIASISGADLVNVPAGGIASATVQGAINELDTEKGLRTGFGQAVVALVGNGALGAGASADETLACAIPATAVPISISLSAAAIAGCVFGQPFNDGAGNIVIRYANVTAAPIAVAADAGVIVAWFDPAAW